MKKETLRFNPRARVELIKDLLYRPVFYSYSGEFAGYVKRNIISLRVAKKLLGSK